MTMKSLQRILAALLLAGMTAHGGVYYFNSSPNTGIPDANPTGISDSISVSGLPSVISGVRVYLNVTGGYNGDLYSYVNLGAGTSVVLLNRIGTSGGDLWGSSTAGFGDGSQTYDNNGTWYSFLLSGVGTDVHGATGTSGSPLTGSYQPDGSSFTTFNGSNPNASWTIFFSDMASGGGNSSSTLVGWGLEITAVPEPSNIALGIFGASSMLVLVVRSRTVRSRVDRVKSAWAQWLDAA